MQVSVQEAVVGLYSTTV